MVTGQLKDKEIEINLLKETVDFTEASVKEAKLNWKQEISNGQRLRGLLDEEKKHRVEMENECTLLQAQIAEEKVKLERYKSLSKLSSSKDFIGDKLGDKANPVHPHTIEEAKAPEMMNKLDEEVHTSREIQYKLVPLNIILCVLL